MNSSPEKYFIIFGQGDRLPILGNITNDQYFFDHILRNKQYTDHKQSYPIYYQTRDSYDDGFSMKIEDVIQEEVLYVIAGYG